MTGEAQLGGTHLYFKGEKEEKGKALAYNQLPMSSSKEVYNFFNLDQKGRGDLLLKLRSEKGEWIDISLIEDLTPIYHDPSAGEPLGEQANQYALVAVQFGRQDKEPEQADAFPRPGSEGNGAQSEGGLPAPDEPGDAGDDEALPRLRPGGRLYLFRPDENTSSGVALWREIAINQDGFYKEVDVHGNENGQDERAATGPPHSHVILPKRWVGGDGASQNSLELYIAYSDITWTWGRIEQLESNRAELEKRTTRVTMGSSRIKQDETTGDNVVLIEDPLERARELASYCHDLLEYYELVEQRKPETEFGEAVLIDEIIKANKADSEGPYLGGHVNEVEIDAVIDRWHGLAKAWNDHYPQTANQLAEVLGSEAFQAAIGDYTHDGASERQRLVGVITLAYLMAAPRSQAGWRVMDLIDRQDGLATMKPLLEPDEQTVKGLIALETGDLKLAETDTDLQSLPLPTLIGMITKSSGALSSIVSSYGEAQFHIHEGDAEKALTRVGNLVNRLFSQTEASSPIVEVKKKPLARLLQEQATGQSGVFRYIPSDAKADFDYVRNAPVPQLLPLDAEVVPSNADEVALHTLAQQGLNRTVQALQVLNAGAASVVLLRDPNVKNSIAAVSAYTAIMGTFKNTITEFTERQMRNLDELAELLLNPLERSIRALQPANSTHRAMRQGLKLTNLQTLKTIVTAGNYWGARMLYAFGALARYASVIGAATDITLGLMTYAKGQNRDNKELTIAGETQAIGGGIGLATGVLAWFPTGAAALFLTITAAGGAAILIWGILQGAEAQRSPLEKALRYSRFGEGGEPPEDYDGYNAIETNPIELPLFDQYHPKATDYDLDGEIDQDPDTVRIIVDFTSLAPEIQEIYRTLYDFDVWIDWYLETTAPPLPDRNWDHPDYQPGDKRAFLRASIDLGAFNPIASQLEAYIFTVTRDGTKRSLNLTDHAVKIVQKANNSGPKQLDLWLEIPHVLAVRGIGCAARIDIDGTNRFHVPSDGAFKWATEQDLYKDNAATLDASEFERLKRVAVSPPE